VTLDVLPAPEPPGALQHDVHREPAPRQVCRVVFGERGDAVVTEGDPVVPQLDPSGEAAVDRVAREEPHELRGVGQIVDGDDLEVGAAHMSGAQHAAADAAQAVDGDPSRHGVHAGASAVPANSRPNGDSTPRGMTTTGQAAPCTSRPLTSPTRTARSGP
jgi:hypothetical protein